MNLDLIKKLEGFRPSAYQDFGSVWTIGYGTTYLINKSRKVQSGDTLNLVQAEQELEGHVDAEIIPFMKDLPNLETLLSESICSLAYNVGRACLKSDQLKLCLENKDEGALCNWFMKWVHCNTEILQGLINRRTYEVNHFKGKIWL